MPPPAQSRPVRLEPVGPVAILWLDSPPVNVLEAPLLDALIERLEEVERSPDFRVVLLASAQERAFAAGANIREMAPMGPKEARRHGERGQAASLRIQRLPLPVVAAVHGSCLGGGCELAMACDIIVASEDAVFGQPEVNLGVMPGWGGTQRLPHRIGGTRARWWIYGGGSFSATEAEKAGLVLRVVPRGELLRVAGEVAQTLAQKPSLALAAAKYATNAALDPALEAALGYELDLWSRLFGTADQKEGMRAFLEKRSASFGGRRDWVRASVGFPWARPSARGSRRRGRPALRRRTGGKKG